MIVLCYGCPLSDEDGRCERDDVTIIGGRCQSSPHSEGGVEIRYELENVFDKHLIPGHKRDELAEDIIKTFTEKITGDWLRELQAESAYKLKALPNPLYLFTISGYIGECAKAIRKGLGG